MQGLINEYAMYLALAADINGEEFIRDNILLFFQNHFKERPTWEKFVALLATQKMNQLCDCRKSFFLFENHIEANPAGESSE